MRYIATAILLFAVLCAPTALTVAGLWLGLHALHWPTVLALTGLADFAPRACKPLATIAWFSRPLAVAGALAALLGRTGGLSLS